MYNNIEKVGEMNLLGVYEYYLLILFNSSDLLYKNISKLHFSIQYTLDIKLVF